jgi:hypothetical protein
MTLKKRVISLPKKGAKLVNDPIEVKLVKEYPNPTFIYGGHKIGKFSFVTVSAGVGDALLKLRELGKPIFEKKEEVVEPPASEKSAAKDKK